MIHRGVAIIWIILCIRSDTAAVSQFTLSWDLRSEKEFRSLPRKEESSRWQPISGRWSTFCQMMTAKEKQPPLHCKKRQPFSSLNGRDLRKVRTNDVNKGTEGSPITHAEASLQGGLWNHIFIFYIQEKDYLISWCTTMSFFYFNCDWSSNPTENIENQVGRALDATDDIARLLSCFMRNFIFLQGEPNKNAESGEYHTPHTTKAGVVPPVSSTLTAGFYFALTLVLPSMTTQLRTALQKIRNF